MTNRAELLKRLDPEGYFSQFLVEGVYPDGRELSQFRKTTIECSSGLYGNEGSAFVRQGGAYISCSVQLSLAPAADGLLINFEMDAIDAVPKEFLEHAQSHLRKIFDKNYLLNPESLRISAESIATGENGNKTSVKRFELRWTANLKIMVLSWDGFMLDTILVAVQAALLNTHIPTRVEYADLGAAGTLFAEDDEFLLGEEVPLQFDIEKIRIMEQKHNQIALKLNTVLVYVPFLVYKNGKAEDEGLILADPPADLCKLLKDKCEMIIGSNRCLYSCTMSISNGGILEQSMIDKMMNIAQQRHESISIALAKCNKRISVK